MVEPNPDLFTLNKKCLSFKIPSTNTQKLITSEPSGYSNEEIKVTNNNNSYILMNIKTTRKQDYSVTPKTFFIKPESSEIVNIKYSLKNYQSDMSNHKFKFDSFLIDQKEIDKGAKIVLMELQKNPQLNIKQSSTKVEVEFLIVDENNKVEQVIKKSNNESQTGENSLIKSQNLYESGISQFTSLKESINFKQNNPDNKSQKEIEELKVEYYKLKEQLDFTVKQYNNLKNRVETELSSAPNGNKKLFDYTATKEKKIPSKIALVLFCVCFILGYFLTQ